MITELEAIPLQIVAGTTVKWRYEHDDFPPDTWVLTTTFIGLHNQISVAGIDEGDAAHHMTLTPVETSAMAPGRWSWSARMDDGTDRQVVQQGVTFLTPDITIATTGADNRTHAEKMLDAIENVQLARAGKAFNDYSVEGASFSMKTDAELQEAWIFWSNRVETERQKAGHVGTRILASFTR